MINPIRSGLLTLLLLSGCGFDGTPTRHNDFVPLTSIEIIAESPAIEVFRTIAAKTSTKLTITGNYSGLFSRDITDQATWSSDTPAVAEFITTVNPNRVSGHVPGSAILNATVGGISTTFKLTVSAATINAMTITPANPSVVSGLTTQFVVNGTFSDNTTQDLTFDSTWTADTSGFASVSDDPASKGLAKGRAAGIATITASFDGLPGTTQLTVTPAILQSITVTPANSTIAGLSKPVNFIATGTFSDGTTADVTSTATWASSLTSIATITTSGVATTIAVGTTSISATLGGISGKTNLTVTSLALKTDGLQISPATPTLSLSTGTTLQLTLTATFTDNSTNNVTSSGSWTILTPSSIATVGTTTGLITASAVGTVTIQAAYLGQSVSTIVTITQ